ncbi:hypothetical protein XELAEV_18020918mg [Xenopus laevis]|uniref:Uncharacterized protein n=1 Tax=Xenopus laevis TaxID=8355 RepID=A0A974D9H8_XENLA|nr:hypothetical protein XELAEV_18020918mg [Xenopus laevis]
MYVVYIYLTDVKCILCHCTPEKVLGFHLEGLNLMDFVFFQPDITKSCCFSSLKNTGLVTRSLYFRGCSFQKYCLL